MMILRLLLCSLKEESTGGSIPPGKHARIHNIVIIITIGNHTVAN